MQNPGSLKELPWLRDGDGKNTGEFRVFQSVISIRKVIIVQSLHSRLQKVGNGTGKDIVQIHYQRNMLRLLGFSKATPESGPGCLYGLVSR